MGWSGGGRSAQWPFAMREAASSQRRYEVQQARGGVTLTIELYRGPTHSGVCGVQAVVAGARGRDTIQSAVAYSL